MPAIPNPAPGESTKRYADWGAWLNAELDHRGMTNAELIRLLTKANAGARSSGLISQWRSGDARPSETLALFIAEVLHLPGPEVLRKAGYEDAARLIEKQSRDPDRYASALRESGLSDEASAVARDYARREDQELQRRLDEYVRLLRRGEQIVAAREQPNENTDAS